MISDKDFWRLMSKYKIVKDPDFDEDAYEKEKEHRYQLYIKNKI